MFSVLLAYHQLQINQFFLWVGKYHSWPFGSGIEDQISVFPGCIPVPVPSLFIDQLLLHWVPWHGLHFNFPALINLGLWLGIDYDLWVYTNSGILSISVNRQIGYNDIKITWKSVSRKLTLIAAISPRLLLQNTQSLFSPNCLVFIILSQISGFCFSKETTRNPFGWVLCIKPTQQRWIF